MIAAFTSVFWARALLSGESSPHLFSKSVKFEESCPREHRHDALIHPLVWARGWCRPSKSEGRCTCLLRSAVECVTVARNPTHSGGHLFWSTHVTDALKRHSSCAIIVGHVHHWLPLRTKARSYWPVSTVGNWLVARYGKLTLSGQSQHSLFASRAGAPHIAPRLRKSVSSATAASTHRKKKRQMRPAPVKEHCAGRCPTQGVDTAVVTRTATRFDFDSCNRLIPKYLSAHFDILLPR